MATPEQIASVMQLLHAAYPNFAVTPDAIKLYALLLSDLDNDLLRATALRHVAVSRFFPTIAELREGATAVLTASDSPRDALTGWALVKRNVARFGNQRGAEALAAMREEDAIAAGVIESLGWRDFCLSDEDDEMSWRARFCNAYDSRTKAEATNASLPAPVRQQIHDVAARLAGPRHLRLSGESPKN